jgi:hypothetical protein
MAFRTKKISQMDPKGSNLASTDLLEISELVSGSYVTKSITGQEIIDSIPSASVAWGDITGTLSSQTDLNTALSGKVPTTRTLTINGTTQDLSANRTFTISTGITIGTTAITSGTDGRMLFQNGGVVSQSANITWDNTANRIQVNSAMLLGSSLISTSAYPLQVVGGAGGSALFSNTTRTQALNINLTTSGETRIYTDYFTGGADQKLILGTFANRANQLVLNTTGNIAIGTTADAGFKLDVNGTARVQGSGGIAQFLLSDTLNNFSLTFYKNASSAYLIESSSTSKMSYGYAGNYWATFNGSQKSLALASSTSEPTPNTTSILDLQSTTKGFLPPRMTTTQKNAIATPAAGLVVYDTTLNKLCLRTASAWETITSL